MPVLSETQKKEILDAIYKAELAGNKEETLKLKMKLPLAPHLAKAAKKLWGKEFLLTSGFDLSAAEVAYGKDWLQN
ncbi:MAG: hypothetical protein IJD04_04435 [Desulfovibrionaceae bacterium]|nr:hypothetical protein [Desulfovibrionaceae bacterium]